jgi:hypothetical protein
MHHTHDDDCMVWRERGSETTNNHLPELFHQAIWNRLETSKIVSSKVNLPVMQNDPF